MLVGRQAESAVLSAALSSALAGRGGCVVLHGEAGIGKSRLAHSLCAEARKRGATVLIGRAVPGGASAPYRPLTEALLQLLRQCALPDDAGIQIWLEHLAPLVPGLVLGSPRHLAVAEAASGPLRAEALLRVLRALCPRGVLLALEDLHWADGDTLAVAEYLADNAGDQSLLVVMTTRDDPAGPAARLLRRARGRPGDTVLGLERLGADAVAAMVTACLPAADVATIERVQAAAEGVPLLVEELLATHGVPASVSESVEQRLAAFSPDERDVLVAAALVGRHVVWDVVAAATGNALGTVESVLHKGQASGLLVEDGDGMAFRHALTRDAVIRAAPPSRRRALAAAALAALESQDRTRPDEWLTTAAELAAGAGDGERAGNLLIAAARAALACGALATAADTFGRAASTLAHPQARAEAELGRVEALALAGRVDEAAAAGERILRRGAAAGRAVAVRAHIELAQAAVAAARWSIARDELGAAEHLGAAHVSALLGHRAAVLAAEVALSGDDLAAARAAAEALLADAGVSGAVRCHAWEIVGRTWRLTDRAAARAAFGAALAAAEDAGLPLWRLRALHELGTIDLFERVDLGRLDAARQLAEEMGALGTVAVLHLQLAAGFTAHWDLERCDDHAGRAEVLGGRLGLAAVRAKALALRTGAASMRGDLRATDELGAAAVNADPEDPMLRAFCRASTGMALVMAGELDAARPAFGDGAGALARLPQAEPISLRALWPLLQAVVADPGAAETIALARRRGVHAFALNAGLIALAEAVLAGHAGDTRRANGLLAASGPAFRHCEPWQLLGHALAAPCAAADGWGDAAAWRRAAHDHFSRRGLGAFAALCTGDAAPRPANPWAGSGVTPREAEVLGLVAAGRANKEIASSLGLSPRTVEKHVESLLRKLGARSRTELAVVAHRANT